MDKEDKNESLVLPPRDYSDIAKLQEPNVLDQFLEHPTTAALEVITGAFAGGGKGLMVSAGRIAQGLVKGQMYDALADELRRLREAGKLPDDLGSTKHGLHTWAELCAMIDDECPDAERLEAMKAMFYAVNKPNDSDKAVILAYELWQMAKQLNSAELLILKTAYENRHRQFGGDFDQWANYIATESGLGSKSLVEFHEKRLGEMLLLTGRFLDDGSKIRPEYARLTGLGMQFCQNIEIYKIDLKATTEQSG